MYRFLRTIIFSPINSICKAFLEIFVFDKQIRRILKGKLAQIYLKKYVRQSLNAEIEDKKFDNKTIIWQYWEQGMENAPSIVKACVDSVEKYKNGHEHIILDRNSIKSYTDIPEYIWDLNQKGVIKSAHMSDIIRTNLLTKHGGVWIDATVLLTDDLAEYITDADLFVFQNDLRIDLDGLNMASYFIASKPHNKILERTQWLLNKYWKENRFLNNYFMFLHAFTLVSQASKEMKDEFSKIPYFSFLSVQRFQKELLNKYDEKRWEQIKKVSSVHKLSYKTHVLCKKGEMQIEGTYYEKLINGELV